MDSERARQLLATERERIEADIAAARRGGPEEGDDRREPGDYDSEGLWQDELDAGLAEDLKGRLEAVERAEERFASGTYGLKFMLPRLDQAVSVLLEDLHQRGLLETTLVALLGEFGRSPKIVNMGRDHWHQCYSGMLAGGGIRGGLVYGSSDKIGAEVKELPVPPEDFGATLLRALNVPLDVRLAPDGFTFPASPGTSIDDLFG